MVAAPFGRRSSSLVDGEARALHSYVFQVAASKTLRAHHALGRLLAGGSTAELTIALREFFTHADSVERAIERIGAMGEDDLVFSTWFTQALARLESHPISSELRSDTPSADLSRLAIELCADYLDRATKLLDETRQRLLSSGLVRARR